MAHRMTLSYRKWCQFSLRGIFLTVTIVAALLGWTVNEVNVRRRAIATITAADGIISYEYASWSERRRARWWERLLGDHYLDRVNEVWLRPTPSALARSDDRLWRSLGELRSLQSLRAVGSPIGDEGLALLSDLVDLRSLDLTATGVTDAGLVHISKMQRLRKLNLSGNKITDAGLTQLRGLTSLEVIRLSGTEITDYSIESLSQLKSLQRAYLIGTRINKAGAMRLSRLLPECNVHYSGGPFIKARRAKARRQPLASGT